MASQHMILMMMERVKKVSKIYVYTDNTGLAKKAFHVAFSAAIPDNDPDSFIVVRDAKSYADKKHSDTDQVYVTDKSIHKKMPDATYIYISDSMSAGERTLVIDTLKEKIAKLKTVCDKDISILDIDVNSLPDILDRDKIAAFIEQYKKAYKKPIVITTNDNKTIGVFDNTSDFEENKNKYDILLTVDEYITIMLTTLGFNAKMIKIERNKEDDET